MKLVNNKSGGRNYSIDLARVIFAILILALHTSPFSDVNFYIYYTVCHTFSRLAVPFFAAVSGYYFFNNYSDQKAFKCLKKLLIAYGFWTTLSCAVDILFGHVDGNIVRFLLEAYLLKGQHALWYMLAMIYTVLLAMLARKIKVNRYVMASVVLVFSLFGVLNNAYGTLFDRFIIFSKVQSLLSSDLRSGMAFIIIPYFSIGYLINTHSSNLHDNKFYWKMTALFSVLFIAEVAIITFTGVHKNNTSCFSTFPLIYFLIKACLQTNGKCGKIGQYFSPIANVLYYSHSILMYSIGSFISSGTVEFVVVCMFAFLIGVVLIVMRSKGIKFAYAIS